VFDNKRALLQPEGTSQFFIKLRQQGYRFLTLLPSFDVTSVGELSEKIKGANYPSIDGT
jgi:hypothetical protein